MGEIKSTLELALEKTGKISISEKEKEEIRRKEIAQKAAGLLNRYLEDRISPTDILREIERMEKKAGDTLREAILSRSIDALTLDQAGQKLLRGMEALKGRTFQDARQKLETLGLEYEREKREAEEKIRIGLEADLKKKGIYGSAVVPNVKGSKEWKERAERSRAGLPKKDRRDQGSPPESYR